MNIKELLTKPHFIISEYLGEFIVEEEEYKSIRTGTLLELDENVSQDIFIQTISLFIEEWDSVIDLFEIFVDEFYAKAHTSCWIHRCNVCSIGSYSHEPVLMKTIKLVNILQHRSRILRTKGYTVNYLRIKLVSGYPFLTIRISHKYKAFMNPVHEPFAVKCWYVCPHTCVYYHFSFLFSGSGTKVSLLFCFISLCRP